MGPRNVDEALQGLAISEQEANRLHNAMKDPEFMKLLEEYSKEISDPKAKAETDEYLRQLEAEGRGEEVYGAGVQLVAPQPGFAVKTRESGAAGGKVFVNICSSNKVGVVQQRQAEQDGRIGTHVEIPICLGKQREGRDASGAPARAWDVVVHPEALERAAASAAFRDVLVESALERVEATASAKVLRRYKLLRTKYKAVAGETGPSVLALRTGSGGDVLDGRVKPTAGAQGANPSHPGHQQHQQQPQQGQVVERGPHASRPGARSSFSFGSKGKTADKKLQGPPQPGSQHASGEVTPEWRLVHRGEVDLADAWGDAHRGLAVRSTCPKELVLHVALPGVNSVASVELDVSCRQLLLSVPARFRLELTLPHSVVEAKASAKLDRARQQLTVVLPVQPPAPAVGLASWKAAAGAAEGKLVQGAGQQEEQQPHHHVSKQQEQRGEQQEELQVQELDKQGQELRVQEEQLYEGQAVEEQGSRGARSGRDCRGAPGAGAPAAQVAAAEGDVMPAREMIDGAKTRNQLLWEQLHSQRGRQEAAGVAPAPPLASACAAAQQQAHDSGGAVEEGGDQQDPDSHAGAGRQQQAVQQHMQAAAGPIHHAQIATLLRPRLKCSLVTDID